MKITNSLLLMSVFLFAGHAIAEKPNEELQRVNQRVSLLERALTPASADALVHQIGRAHV